jgi:hypothetical protein
MTFKPQSMNACVAIQFFFLKTKNSNKKKTTKNPKIFFLMYLRRLQRLLQRIKKKRTKKIEKRKNIFNFLVI